MNPLNSSVIKVIYPLICKSYEDEKQTIYDALAIMLFYLDMYKDELKFVPNNLINLQKSLKKGNWSKDNNTNYEAFTNNELRAFRDEALSHNPELYKLFQSMDGDLQKLLNLINNVVTASINNLLPAVKSINHNNQKFSVAIAHAIDHLIKNDAKIVISHHKNTIFYKLIEKTLKFTDYKLSSPESAIKKAIEETFKKV